MAVTFVSKESSAKYLELFDIDPALIASLQKAGVSVSAQSNAVIFKKGAATLGKVPCSTGAMTMAQNGSIGPVSKQHLQKLLTEKGMQILGNMEVNEIDELPDVAEVPAVEAPDDESPGIVVGMNLSSSPEEMMKKSPVALRDATQLYQAVSGSSSGSIYITVALSKDLKVAARIRNGEVSIRVEGNVQKYVMELDAVGLSVKSDYASVHMSGGEEELLRKAVGALIASLPVEFTTPMPNIKKIVGKGV